ncbi:hypothetical protein PR048_011794 [Dryococelus australis]|uniref:Uncharacterized protein n=1 Tax=Dryococelus australis TaxID=614101 RepID=A0ABQ9HMM5_9NEOP|nr:hypothetical protein PR048_011794 [Dryococelus australis]
MLLPSEGKRTRKMFNITQIQEVLGSMKEYMLFIHAFTGCDTTSSLHGKDKSLPFTSSPQEVAEAGEAFMCAIYGGKPSENINKLHYLLYLRTVAKQKSMVPLECQFYLQNLKLLNSIHFVFSIGDKSGKTG